VKCLTCGWRWRQKDGLCRACGRAAGLYASMTTLEMEAAHVAAQHAKLAGGVPVPEDELAPRPARPIQIAGEEFEVVWDGA